MNMPKGPEPRQRFGASPEPDAHRAGNAVQDVDADRLLLALETPPHITVPSDFAARVMRALPKQRRRRSLRGARAIAPRFGVAAAMAAMVLAVLLLVVMPSHAAQPLNTQLHLAMQLLLSLEVLCGVLWFALVRWRFR